MNLSIIIPNYNGEKLLKKNLPAVLESVRNYKNGTAEIIIPDDPSTDKSEDIIKNFINNIKNKNITGKTISNKNKNESGFSKNVNRAVHLATGDILVLLNSDVTPRADFLEFLLPHFEDKNIFAVGCIEESIERDQKILRGRGIGSWERGFLAHSRGSLDKNNTLWASGGSSAFRKKVWDKLGGLEELYNPFYWEDIDLSFRAQKSGYSIVFEKRSIVTHEHEKGAIKTSFTSKEIKKIAYRNQFIFAWLNITDKDLLFSHIVWLPYHLLTALLRKDWSFYSGFFAAVGKLNAILKKREKYITKFIKTDKDVLQNFQT